MGIQIFIVVFILYLVNELLIKTRRQYALLLRCNLLLFVVISLVFSFYTAGAQYGVDSLKFYNRGVLLEVDQYETFAQAEAMYFVSGILRNLFGLSYYSYNLIGAFISHLALFVLCWHRPNLNEMSKVWIACLVLLPGFHFWNASFSKDSIQLLGVALFLFSDRPMLRTLGIVMIGFVRPHIALLLMVAEGYFLVLSRRLTLWSLSFLGMSVASIVYILGYFVIRLDLDALSVEALWQGLVDYGDDWKQGGLALTDTSTPLAILEFLFRPYLWEAESWNVLLSSVEAFAVGVVVVYAIFASNYKKSAAWCFLVTIVILLSFTNPNVGTATRKKQVLPIVALWLVLKDKRSLSSNTNITTT